MVPVTHMRIDSQISPTIPFHVAKAYGTSPNAQVSRTQGVSGPGATNAPQNVQKDAVPQARLSSAGQSLVAGVVPGRVDFSGDQPRQATSLSMYRHPADRNAAATAVNVGRSLDVSG